MISKNVKIAWVALLLFGAVAMAGCSSSTQTGAGGKAVKTVVVGVGNEHKNYSVLNSKGEPEGFEIAVLTEVNKLLPQYKFEYAPSEFNTVVARLGSGKVDLAAHQFELNAERKEKFLYGDVGVSRYDLYITVREDRNDIASLDDLAAIGGTLEVGKASSNSTYLVDQWNKHHGNRLNIVLKSSDDTIRLQNLAAGKTDAFIETLQIVNDYKKTFNANIKIVGAPLNTSVTHYLYPKNNAGSIQLKQDVDGALKTLKENGTLKRLSLQYLGDDYSAS